MQSMELLDPSGSFGASPTTARFRTLVGYFLSPSEEARLVSYQKGEAQLTIERPEQAPIFILILDGAKEEERSLRLRLAKLASENVSNQHVVIVGNHAWLKEALERIGKEFYPKMYLYQLNSDGEIEHGKNRLAPLWSALKAQKGTQSSIESEPAFAERCARAEDEKQRLLDAYLDDLKRRPPAAVLVLLMLYAVLFGIGYLAKSAGADAATTLVLSGGKVPAFIREGEWWRLFSSMLLFPNLLHFVLNSLFLLALGIQLEKLVGSARLLTLYIVSGLVGALVGTFFPTVSRFLITGAASGALTGVLAGGAFLAVRPEGIPISQVSRLRRQALANLALSIILLFVPGVDRMTHAGGAVAGIFLVGLGVVRPLRPRTTLTGPARPDLIEWVHRGVAGVLGLLLVVSVALALLNGQPWHPTTEWRKRLGTAIGKELALGGTPSPGTVDAAGKPLGEGPQSDLSPVRHALGESGIAIELPRILGELRSQPEEGGPSAAAPVYGFGDLAASMQALEVVVRKTEKPYKKKGQREQALDQAIAIVRADRLKGGQAKLLSGPTKGVIPEYPSAEMTFQLQESIKGTALIVVRNSGVFVLFHSYTELLPDAIKLDLRKAAQSLTENGQDSDGKRRKKRSR